MKNSTVLLGLLTLFFTYNVAAMSVGEPSMPQVEPGTEYSSYRITTEENYVMVSFSKEAWVDTCNRTTLGADLTPDARGLHVIADLSLMTTERWCDDMETYMEMVESQEYEIEVSVFGYVTLLVPEGFDIRVRYR